MNLLLLFFGSSICAAQGRVDESIASIRSAELLLGWRGGLDPAAVDRELLSGRASPDPELRERVQQVRLLWDLGEGACTEDLSDFRAQADAVSAWATVCPRMMFDEGGCDPLSALFAMRSLVRAAQLPSGDDDARCAAPALAHAQVKELAHAAATMDWPETGSWFDPRAFLALAGPDASAEGMTALLDAALALGAAQSAIAGLAPTDDQQQIIGATERACGRELTSSDACAGASDEAAAQVGALSEVPGGARAMSLRRDVCDRYRAALGRAGQDPGLAVPVGLLTLASGASPGQPACVLPVRAFVPAVGRMMQGGLATPGTPRIWAGKGLMSTLLLTSDVVDRLSGADRRETLGLIEAVRALLQAALDTKASSQIPLSGASVVFALDLLDQLAVGGNLDPRSASELALIYGAYLVRVERAEVDRLPAPEPVLRLWAFDQAPAEEALSVWCGRYTFTQDQWEVASERVARIQALEPDGIAQACNSAPVQQDDGALLVGVSKVVWQLLKDPDLDVDRLAGLAGTARASAAASAPAQIPAWRADPAVCDRTTWATSHVVTMLAADRQFELIAAEARGLSDRGKIDAATRAMSYLSAGRSCEAELLEERQLGDLSAILQATDSLDPELFRHRLDRRSVVVQPQYAREILLASPNPSRRDQVLVLLANDLIARASGGPFRLAPGSPWSLDGGLAVHVRLPLGVYRVETSAGPASLRVDIATPGRLGLPPLTQERTP